MPLGQSAGGAMPRRKKAVSPGQAKALITASDFTYLGGFTSGTSRGLTYRRRDGTFYLLSATTPGTSYTLREFQVPALSMTPASFATATYDVSYNNFWPNVYIGANEGNGVTGGGELWGLHYDEIAGNLLFFAHDDYDGSPHYSINYATLNAATQTGSSVDNWKQLSNLSYKATKGACKIPAEAQAVLGGGKRLAIGFGGYQSQASNGPAHIGPACYAINPDNIYAVTAHQGIISGGQMLQQHPLVSGNPAGSSPSRALRDTNSWQFDSLDTQDWDAIAPEGYHYFGAGDVIRQGGVWIETSSKRGFCVFHSLSYNGASAEILTANEVSRSGSGASERVIVDITLAQAMTGIFTGIVVHVPTNGAYYKAVVQSYSHPNMRVQVWGSTQSGSPGSLTVGGTINLGTLYFNGAVGGDRISLNRPTLSVYDPDDLYAANTDPMPLAGQYSFPGPQRWGTSSGDDGRGLVNAVCFDEITNRLYMLDGYGQIGVWQLAS